MTRQLKTSSTKRLAKTLLLIAFLGLVGMCDGCASKTVYTVDPYVAKQLAADIDALCDFTIAGPDGKPLKVRAMVHLRSGEYVKAIHPATAPSH